MKRVFALCAMALTLAMALPVQAAAAETVAVCYPTSITRSEDGGEIRKIYDLSPTDDPAGIPRSDFEQDGFRYTLTDLLKQELPEYEERQHTETVSLESKSKDMASVLALLPQEREFITDDGLTGTLTLQSIDWQTDNTASTDGYALGDRFTAVATYTGSATSSYVKGYTVTADYTGTVSRIALNKTRYVAIFEGTAIVPVEPAVELPDVLEAPKQFNWAYVLVPLGVVAAAGGGVGIALFLKRRRESDESGGDAE